MSKRKRRAIIKSKKPQRPSKYCNAAIQRRTEARHLTETRGDEPGAIYLIGVAAENLLRVFIYQDNPYATIPKNQQHDLKILARKSFLRLINNEDVFEKVERANTDLYEIWEIGHRYRDAKQLKKFYNKKRAKLGSNNLKRYPNKP
jgi:hypothetical protein